MDLVPAVRGVSRCLLLERPGEGSILDRLNFQSAAPEAAQLVLIAGSEGDRLSLDWYAELLAPLARRGVPAHCLNPDRTLLTAHGSSFGSGQIAETYAALDGEVVAADGARRESDRLFTSTNVKAILLGMPSTIQRAN